MATFVPAVAGVDLEGLVKQARAVLAGLVRQAVPADVSQTSAAMAGPVLQPALPQPLLPGAHPLLPQATGDPGWEPAKPIYRFDSGADRIEVFLEFQ